MRRIYIDDKVAQLAKRYADDLISNKRRALSWKKNSMPLKLLFNFYHYLHNDYYSSPNRYVSVNYESLSQYVALIILHYRKIILLKPHQFYKFHKINFSRWDDDINEKIAYNGKIRTFYEHIIDCMRYDDLRSNLLRDYIQELKIKSCVYCNAQYAITTDEFTDSSGKHKRLGTYQFDHFMPKSKYPYLCTSFFNLQPSCDACNKSKSDRNSLFNLYTESKDDIDVFHFKLIPDKAIKEYIDDDMTLLKVKLISTNFDLLKNHQNLFHIDLIYAQHLDVVKSIIVKCKFYSPDYMKSLTDGLSTLFPHGVIDPKYYFWGYYMEKDFIHFQPLSLLVQDIVEIFGI